MINGLTSDNGVARAGRMQYKGKISTGYGPGEGPNKENHPVAAGYFRILRSKKEKVRVGKKTVERQAWKLNKTVQERLEQETNSKQPTYIKCVSMVQTPEQMWSSSLCMFNKKRELVCHGYGENSVASYLTDKNGERVRTDRECLYKKCPDYISGHCSESGSMIVWPAIDHSSLRPYKFTTGSINSIMNIESMLNKIYDQQKLAYAIKKYQMKEDVIPFQGLLGMVFYLRHKQIQSGGRSVYITELIPSPDVEQEISRPMIELAQSDNATKLISEASGYAKSIDIEEVKQIDLMPDDDVEAETVAVDDDVSAESESEGSETSGSAPNTVGNEAASALDE